MRAGLFCLLGFFFFFLLCAVLNLMQTIQLQEASGGTTAVGVMWENLRRLCWVDHLQWLDDLQGQESTDKKRQETISTSAVNSAGNDAN